MPNIIKQRYLKIDLDICVLNYKLAKQTNQPNKIRQIQTKLPTPIQTQTNPTKEQKQLFKIPNNPNLIKAFFVNFNPNQTAVTFEATNNYGVNLAKTLSGLKITFQELNAYKSSLFKTSKLRKTEITEVRHQQLLRLFIAQDFANINSNAPIFQTYLFKANLIQILSSYQATLNMLSKCKHR